MGDALVVGAVASPQMRRLLVWNGGGEIIDYSSRGVWSVLEGTGPLQHLEAGHATCRWRVIGSWVGVGRWCRWNPIFHDGYLVRAVRVHPPQADIGKETVTGFRAYVYSGYLPEDFIDIRVKKRGQVGWVENSPRTLEGRNIRFVSDHVERR